MVCFALTVKGKVQGVFFRKHTKLKANELKLKGMVKNMPDGDVYIEIEGDNELVQKFITWCYTGSPDSIVENIIIKDTNIKNYSEFNIKF